MVSSISTQGKGDGVYQTGFIRWRAADNGFDGWSLIGVRLNARGEIEFDPATATADTDPYGPGTYHGGSFFVGEALSPEISTAFHYKSAIASWNASIPRALDRSAIPRSIWEAVEQMVCAWYLGGGYNDSCTSFRQRAKRFRWVGCRRYVYLFLRKRDNQCIPAQTPSIQRRRYRNAHSSKCCHSLFHASSENTKFLRAIQHFGND
jgi:hypothetical protein